MPRKYIGSSSVSRVKTGYRGSVLSKRYKQIWRNELRDSPNLFKTRILSTHDSKKDALEAELNLQIKYNVVKSDEFINLSLARPNGFFGMSKKGIKLSEETKQKMSISFTGIKKPAQSKALKGRKRPDHSKSMLGEKNHMFGRVHPNKGKKINQPRAVCEICGMESTRSAITRHKIKCNLNEVETPHFSLYK